MGNSIADVRKEAEKQSKDKDKMEERLQILERMINSRLERDQQQILAGRRNDQEIHNGTIVQEYKQV